MFLGYKRPDGSVGIRNYILVLPTIRITYSLAQQIATLVPGTKTIVSTGETGRSAKDRETIARVLLGLALNGNVGGVLLLGDMSSHYKELNFEKMAEIIRVSGKPLKTIDITDCGGQYDAFAQGLKKARHLCLEVSDFRREPCELKDLTLGVKCGMSDPTSGVIGNPVVGEVFDKVVSSGGTALFSETTEVIGAEHIIAKRCLSDDVRKVFLNKVHNIEEKAKATGEDIRDINPIPENINAGITTLEEKSLGAIAKSGSMPISGVLEYGERPASKGLFFMDGWMSSLSLPMGAAAAGANLFLYQMGGQGLPEVSPPMPSYSGGIIAPMMYLTGNPRTYSKAIDGIDFYSGEVMEKDISHDEVGKKLLEHVIKISSGSITKSEAFNLQEPVEFYFQDPSF